MAKAKDQSVSVSVKQSSRAAHPGDDERRPDVVIADALCRISDAMEELSKGPLKKSTIEILVQRASGAPMGTVRNVLSSLESLKKLYLK